LIVKVAFALVVVELSEICEGVMEQEILEVAVDGTAHVKATEPVKPFEPPTTTEVLPLWPTAAMVMIVGLAPMLNA